MSTTATPAHRAGAMPRQIPYIIGNEACERFSFYRMRNILVPFPVTRVRVAGIFTMYAKRYPMQDHYLAA